MPDRWKKLVNEVDKEKNIKKIENSIKRGTPFRNVEWQSITARKMKLESTMRPIGRPKNVPDTFISDMLYSIYIDRSYHRWAAEYFKAGKRILKIRLAFPGM